MKQMSPSFFPPSIPEKPFLFRWENIHSIPMRVPNSIDYYIIVQLNGKLELVILLDETEYTIHIYICINAIDWKTEWERERMKERPERIGMGEYMVCELLWTEVIHINNMQYVRTVLQRAIYWYIMMKWMNGWHLCMVYGMVVGMKTNILSQWTNQPGSFECHFPFFSLCQTKH